MRCVKCRIPKGYRKTNLFFNSSKSAEMYVNNLNQEFLLSKARKLEYPDISKKRKKDLIHSKPKKYLLTSVGSKFCLWESY